MLRYEGTDARGNVWTIEQNTSTRRWEVACNGLATFTARTVLLAFGYAREHAPGLAWREDTRCKVCDSWHETASECPKCYAERMR